MNDRITLTACALLALPAYALAQTLPADLSRTAGVPFGATTNEEVVFDQGPSTGSDGGCWWNQSDDQNFTEQVTFAQGTTVTGIRIFTCVAPMPGNAVSMKILSDSAGTPGAVLQSQDGLPDSWLAEGNGYAVTLTFDRPFDAVAGVTYWYGLSGSGFDIGQTSVLTPADGQMAQFSGPAFQFHTSVGDQMFQLLGGQGSGGCTLSLALDYDGAVQAQFELGTAEPSTWNIYLSLQNTTVPLVSLPLPQIPVIQVPIPLPLSGFGTIGILTTLTTAADGIVCDDWQTVDTQ